jgi:AcrR family transcriptional regulator
MARKPRGQLREEILAATNRLLLETRDMHEVSIDAVVEAVGCTPPALYYYFKTKDDLMTEASDQLFQAFAEELEAALPNTEDPIAELRARAHAYLDWGLDHPEQYRVLFMALSEANAESPRVEPAEAHGLGQLIDNLQRAFDSGALRPADPWTLAVEAWSLVHGITALLIVRQFIPREFGHAVLDSTTEAFIQHHS